MYCFVIGAPSPNAFLGHGPIDARQALFMGSEQSLDSRAVNANICFSSAGQYVYYRVHPRRHEATHLWMRTYGPGVRGNALPTTSTTVKIQVKVV